MRSGRLTRSLLRSTTLSSLRAKRVKIETALFPPQVKSSGERSNAIWIAAIILFQQTIFFYL
jgi:hypothetical protein